MTQGQATYHLARFGLSEMTECGAALRKMGLGANSMEEVANRIVHYLYHQFSHPDTKESNFALVRFFKTHSYHELTRDRRDFATQILGEQPRSPRMKCLTLLATMGDRTEWRSVTASIGHQAIPLASEQLVAQSPMISQLIQQLGLELSAVIEPDADLIMDLEQKTFNVFHVPEAQGSAFVPAQQEFVIPANIRSVLGFGGMLPSGNLMSIILFSKVFISRDTADLFKPLALNAKMAILPFDRGAVFMS